MAIQLMMWVLQEGKKPYDVGEDIVLPLLWDGVEPKHKSMEQKDNEMLQSCIDIHKAAEEMSGPVKAFTLVEKDTDD